MRKNAAKKDALMELLNAENESGGSVTIRLKRHVYDRYTELRDEYKEVTGRNLPLGDMGDIMFEDLCSSIEEAIKMKTLGNKAVLKKENQIEID